MKIKLFSFEKDIHSLFEATLFLKGVQAVFETVGGLLFLLIHADFIVRIVAAITKGELAEESNDVVANFLMKWAHGLTTDTLLFIAVFLLIHGMVNFILVAGVARERLWAYRTSIVIFVLFILYAIYRFSYSHTITLASAILFDVILVILIAHDYRHLRRRLRTASDDR